MLLLLLQIHVLNMFSHWPLTSWVNTGTNKIHFSVETNKNDIITVSTHSLISTDRVDLSPKHDRSEDQEEETLKAEEDEENDGCWWREVTALWRRRGKREVKFDTC